MAIATDGAPQTALPVFALNDYPGIANFIVRHLDLAG
jgi:hypothetical protein